MAISLSGKMQVQYRVIPKRCPSRERQSTQKIRLLEYGVSNEDAFFGLACGGKIRVMLEPVGHSISILALKD